MKKEIELNGEKIEYTHKVSSRARNLRLAVYGGGELVVSSPRFLSDKYIERFIIEKTEWVINKIAKFKDVPKRTPLKERRRHYKEYKEKARVLVENRLEYFNQFYNFKYNNICIRNQKTRWGSCSKKGNLNFNYKIALLPEKHADYIVVHELCHLGQFNHSSKFWDLVAKCVPDYKQIRKEMKKNFLRSIPLGCNHPEVGTSKNSPQ